MTYILSTWFQLKNLNAPARLHLARNLFSSAQLGSTQLDSAQEISAGTHNYYLPNLFCLVALQECLHFWAES